MLVFLCPRPPANPSLIPQRRLRLPSVSVTHNKRLKGFPITRTSAPHASTWPLQFKQRKVKMHVMLLPCCLLVLLVPGPCSAAPTLAPEGESAPSTEPQADLKLAAVSA